MDEAVIIIVDVAVDHKVGVMADMGADVGLVITAESSSRRSNDTGGEVVGTEAAGCAVGETVGPAVVGGTVGEAVGTAELGLEVGEPVGMAVVAARVEVAVGPGLDGPEVGQVVRVVVGAELGRRLGAEVHRDTVGEAVGINAINVVGDAVGETVRPAMEGSADGEVVGTAQFGLEVGRASWDGGGRRSCRGGGGSRTRWGRSRAGCWGGHPGQARAGRWTRQQ